MSTLQSERETIEKDREHALVSIFAIHQTKDPENVIRESMETVLKVHDRRILTALLEKYAGEKWIFSRSSNAFYEKKTGAIRTNEPSSADIHNAAITRVEQIINELLEV